MSSSNLSKEEIAQLASGTELQQALRDLLIGRISLEEWDDAIRRIFGEFIGEGDSELRNEYVIATGTRTHIDGPFHFWGMREAAGMYWKYRELFGIGDEEENTEELFPYIQIASCTTGEYCYLSLDNGGVWCCHHDSMPEMWAESNFALFEQVIMDTHIPATQFLRFQELCAQNGLSGKDPYELEEDVELLGKICEEAFADNWRMEQFFNWPCFAHWEDQEATIKQIKKATQKVRKAKRAAR